jgi:hypothetical protein
MHLLHGREPTSLFHRARAVNGEGEAGEDLGATVLPLAAISDVNSLYLVQRFQNLFS